MVFQSGSVSDPHGLSQTRALGLLVLYCLVYVLPLYASAATRPSASRSRDAPESIRARIRAVSLSTAACSLSTLLILYGRQARDEHATAGPVQLSPWHHMGYWPVDLAVSAKALLLTALLFAGPLYECLVIDGAWAEWARLEPVKQAWRDWPTWRNLVAGPVTEECLFRSAAVPLLLLAGSSHTRVIFLSPLVFGLAHLHHFYEFRLTNPGVSLAAAIARSVLQFSYTSLFGMYATFIFVRTASLPSVVLIHTFCNYMGLPRFWGSVEPHWLYGSEPRASSSTRLWTGIYYALLVGGLVLWWQNLYALTETPMALARFLTTSA
ncbi:hypothetical protein S7711_04543 [Stachybotrys chartarum IBT 7711]|uniref:intramembrane prenyl-peptidase Rce1 n=1 Tax=Stachybotrys chartarum (strain CBS 109288 / IBT 7711) TaxID=1280523 RepID=A0A084APR1_STACB|nr:hypothetical protein S7711_04543 [Stachybotrys chartarum IBT 7711]